MTKTLTFITLVVVALSILSATGCKKNAGETASDAAEATGKAVGNAAEATGKAIGNAAEATNDYLTQTKDEAIEATQKKIVLLDKKWQELQNKAAPATAEAKAELQNAKDQMAKTLADAKTKLIEAKDASIDTWQKNVQPALDVGMDEAQKLYDDMAAKFDSK